MNLCNACGLAFRNDRPDRLERRKNGMGKKKRKGGEGLERKEERRKKVCGGMGSECYGLHGNWGLHLKGKKREEFWGLPVGKV